MTNHEEGDRQHGERAAHCRIQPPGSATSPPRGRNAPSPPKATCPPPGKPRATNRQPRQAPNEPPPAPPPRDAKTTWAATPRHGPD